MTTTVSESGHIQVTIDNDCARVTLSRPEVRNAQTPEMWRELGAIAAAMPDSVRFVVLAGDGQDFSAGLDRTVLGGSMVTDLQADPHGFISAAQMGFSAWTRMPQVVIAAVHGNAIGAGFQLALASDLIIAAPGARFAMRETSIGLVPDLGGTGALIDALGYRRAFGLCVTGEFLSAEKAHDWGLVFALAEELDAGVSEVLERLRGVDAGSVADLKSLLRRVARDLDSWDTEREVQVRRLSTLFGSSPA